MAVPSIEELIGASSQRLTPFRDYRMIRGGSEAAFLSLFAPPQGQVLVTAATRVNHFNELSETLADLGLPSRMKDCLVYYACWQLLSQRLAVGQEDLKVSSRQTEAGSEDRTEVLDGSQVSTQVEDKDGTQTQQRDSTTTDAKDATVTTSEDGTTTEDKTPTITGTRESTTTELKAATQQEDTNLEQTEDKNETLNSTGSETTGDTKTSSASSRVEEESVQQVEKDVLGKDFEESEGDHDQTSKTTFNDRVAQDKSSEVTGWSKQTPLEGQVHEHTFSTNTPTWDHADPPKQGLTTVDQDTWTTDTQVKREDHHETNLEKGEVSHHTGNDSTRDWGDEHGKKEGWHEERNIEDTTASSESTKEETASETSGGTASNARTDYTTGGNLLLNVQEKVATANEDNVTLFTETTTQGTAEDNVTLIDKTTVEITDEDATSVLDETTALTTAEDNTITTDQTTDNTTTSQFATTKTTSLEAIATNRDRLQTAQYYKMLLDMEVNNRKMRSWVSRGL